jgi:hypothetical protein
LTIETKKYNNQNNKLSIYNAIKVKKQTSSSPTAV